MEHSGRARRVRWEEDNLRSSLVAERPTDEDIVMLLIWLWLVLYYSCDCKFKVRKLTLKVVGLESGRDVKA